MIDLKRSNNYTEDNHKEYQMYKKFFITLLVASLISSTAFFLFPKVELFADQLFFAISIFAFTTQTVALTFFLVSLKAFKKGLKTAYIILAIGIFFFSILLTQLPISTFVQIVPLVLSWSVVITSLIGAIIVYIAIRKFASLLNIRASTVMAISLTLLGAALSTLLPHLDLGVDEKIADGIFGCFIAASILIAVSACLVLQIKNKLGPMYTSAMNWLAIALFAASFAYLHETITKLLPIFSNEALAPYFYYGLSLWPFFIAAILFLKASLSFREVSRAAATELPEDATILDIINYVAQMASNPTAIDVGLDKVRQITATTSLETLTAADKTALRDVYLYIEQYLITKEPLRTFTKESLRTKLPDYFRQTLTKS